MTTGNLRLKRVYDAPSDEDGRRILVDRLWPRGLTREAAAVDEWLKAVAPSADLRRRFHHDPEGWDAFRRLYQAELDDAAEATEELLNRIRAGPVTLLFAARDVRRNNAVVLKAYLEARLKTGEGGLSAAGS